jgi:hypothetical protein
LEHAGKKRKNPPRSDPRQNPRKNLSPPPITR